MLPAIIRSLAAAIAVSLLASSSAFAEISPEHDKAISKIRADMRRAGGLFREKKWEASARLIGQAKERLAELPANDEEVASATKSIFAEIAKAEELLAQKGIAGAARNADKGTGDDQAGDRVSFRNTIASVLHANCAGCHGGDMPRRGLRIESYASLARGGQSGPVVQPGNPARSLLVAKLKGIAPGKRMPLDKDPLSNEEISAIETWVREGATFDGANPTTALDRLSTPTKSVEASKNVSADELNRERSAEALRAWKLAFPKQPPEQVETDSFLLLGKLPRGDLQHVGESAETARKNALRFLRLPPKAGTKGRITIFVLPSSYDYGEFGKMVEKRQLPRDSRGHWKVDDDAGYIVLGPPPTEKSLQLETQLILLVSAVMAKSWGTPQWFADGLGHFVAEKANRRDPDVRTWKKQASQAIRQIASSESILKSTLPPETSGMVNWAFTQAVLQDPRRSGRLLQDVSTGTDFETSFTSVFGTTPQDACEAWVRRNGGGKQRR